MDDYKEYLKQRTTFGIFYPSSSRPFPSSPTPGNGIKGPSQKEINQSVPFTGFSVLSVLRRGSDCELKCRSGHTASCDSSIHPAALP